jgi:DNA-binding IclR family transcriptional regulator
MDSKQKSKKYGSALDKALAVLELITEQRQSVGLPDLATKMDMPRQSVHRILLQLEELGLIIRDASRDRFFVGPRLSQLSVNALFSENHNMPTRVILQELVSNIQESCNIGILDGMDFVYLDRVQSEQSLRIHLDAGNRVPAYCTSGGKVLLAHLNPKIRRNLSEFKTLKAYTKTTLTTSNTMEKDFKTTLNLGYSTNNQEFTAGVVGVAVPIVDNTGRAIAALACHAPLARISLDELKGYVPKLQSSAAQLGQYWT